MEEKDKPLWEQALELEHYIRDYVPGGWKAPIAQLMFVPMVLEADIVSITKGIIPGKFKEPAIKWAIRAYLMGSRKPCKTQEDLKKFLRGG